jgi:predicted Fe-S protein YdhL (DUF1289 family)|tara:strand:- start:822 stop:971 length:150 start_codon:yes stop_codon:yes gene_type:complete
MTTKCCYDCKLDDNKEYCIGCGRTVEEIKQVGLEKKRREKSLKQKSSEA